MKGGTFSARNPLEIQFHGDSEAIRAYLAGKTLKEVSDEIDRTIGRTRTLFRKYNTIPEHEAKGMKIAVALGGIEQAKEYMRTHTIEHLVERFMVADSTVYNWETRLGIRSLRTCRNCQGEFKHEEMWINSKGTVQDRLCSAPECKKTRRRGFEKHAERLDMEFIGLKAVLAMTSKRISRAKSTKGPLRHQYQGRTAIEMEQAA